MRTDSHLMYDHGRVRMVIEYDLKRIVLLHWDKDRKLWKEMRSVWYAPALFNKIMQTAHLANYKALITPNERN